MHYFWLLTGLLATLFENTVAMDFITRVFGFRVRRKLGIFGAVSFVVVASCFVLLYQDSLAGSLLNLAFIAFFAAYALIFLNGNHFMHLLIPVIMLCCTYVINISVLWLMITFFDCTAEEIAAQDSLRFLGVLVTKAALFAVSRLLLSFTRHTPIRMSRPERISFSVLFLTLLTDCILVSMMQLCAHNHNYQIIYRTMTILGMVLMNVCTIYLIYRNIRVNQKNVQMSMLTLRLSNQQTSFDSLSSLYAEIRKSRHDLRNKLLCLDGLLQTGQLEEAKAYLHSIQTEPNALCCCSLIRTGNTLLDMILNLKLTTCRQKQIDLRYDICADWAGFDPADLCSLLANLFDNAIEASAAVENPQIRLCIRREKSYLCIRLSNRVSAPVLAHNPDLRTTKSDHENHGFGILSIRDLVKKYQGALNFREENGCFIADLRLLCRSFPLPAKQEENATILAN